MLAMSKPCNLQCGHGPGVHSYVAMSTLGMLSRYPMSPGLLWNMTTYSIMFSTQGLQCIAKRSATE